MNDASMPAELRKKLNAELEQFNSQTTQTLADKSAACVRRNASADELTDYIMDALKNGELVGMQGTREIYEVTYNGITRQVAITVSDNGFIIGANPKSIPKP